jgi:cephalosporin hydroxylase
MWRSSELPIDSYDTDKVQNGYLKHYDRLFAEILQQPLVLLELGTRTGGSLRLWRDYFPLGQVVGIDISPAPQLVGEERITFFQGDQSDIVFLDSVARYSAPFGFDVIIDDAAHIASLARVSFWHLFDHHLKPGGMYVIEDWGTGYWDDWPDGQKAEAPDARTTSASDCRQAIHSHRSGMVGFVKELVDEQGAADLTRMRQSGSPKRNSKFSSLLILPSIVFVQKSS